MAKPLILASSSPRRQELLQKTGISFTIDPADIDETIDLSLQVEEEIQRLAFRKADAVLRRHPDAMILGSDTVVYCQGEVLGKPKDAHDARRMLGMLSDHRHEVITGLCLLSNRRRYSTVSTAYVTFGPMSEEEIDAYVSCGEPFGKAGSYAIQGKASCYITGIEGDYYSIVGLPVHLVYEELKNRELY